MPERSPKHGLTRNGRGWIKRPHAKAKPRWIVSARACPTGELADAYYEAHFAEIQQAATDAADPVLTGTVSFLDAAESFVREKEARKLHKGTIRDYDDALLRA